MIRRRAWLGAASAALARPASSQGRRGPVMPAATLFDQDGRAVSTNALMERGPVGLGFFFTGCTTLCPPQTVAMQALQEDLAGSGTLLLSVTLDPFGDSPAAMRAYAERFELSLGLDHGWLLLGGDPRELARIWKAFETSGDAPADHAALLWMHRRRGREWRRESALAPTAALAAMLREPA